MISFDFVDTVHIQAPFDSMDSVVTVHTVVTVDIVVTVDSHGTVDIVGSVDIDDI